MALIWKKGAEAISYCSPMTKPFSHVQTKDPWPNQTFHPWQNPLSVTKPFTHDQVWPKDQDRNDNHSPQPVIREISP